MYSFKPKKFGSNSCPTGVSRSFLVMMIGFAVLAAEWALRKKAGLP